MDSIFSRVQDCFRADDFRDYRAESWYSHQRSISYIAPLRLLSLVYSFECHWSLSISLDVPPLLSRGLFPLTSMASAQGADPWYPKTLLSFGQWKTEPCRTVERLS